ncbi:MAG: DNA-binding response regulator [Spirochaetaceae bacterium]|nr:MAG: DNA-binding response regulator [Spirochaetaceae bacterium]
MVWTARGATRILGAMGERVLIVEDEPELNAMIRDFLSAHGYESECVFDGAVAVRRVFEDPPDIVVLDLNLPGLAGLDVARTITSQTTVPVIVTTARGEEDDRLGGFAAGVDDYLVKPFSLPELVMRIAAILRRGKAGRKAAGRDDAVVRVGELRLDCDRREVFVGERSVRLTAVQFAILERLARSPRRVFSRLQLLESFQPDAFDGYQRTIDVHIKNIRKQIEANPRRPERLVTVRGVGYRLQDLPSEVVR